MYEEIIERVEEYLLEELGPKVTPSEVARLTEEVVEIVRDSIAAEFQG